MSRQAPTFLFHPLFLGLIIVISVFLSIPLTKNIHFQLSQRNASLIVEEEVSNLEQEVESLREEVTDQQQSFFQEKIIRNELQMQKEGERVIQLPNLPQPTPLPTPMATPTRAIPEQWNTVLFE